MLQMEQIKPPLSPTVKDNIALLKIPFKKQMCNRKQVHESQRDRCLGCRLEYEYRSYALTFSFFFFAT